MPFVRFVKVRYIQKRVIEVEGNSNMENNQHPMTLPYDIKSSTSIFEYSKGLLGKTLRDFVWKEYESKKGKGSLGQMVENIFFLLETNNYAGADFS